MSDFSPEEFAQMLLSNEFAQNVGSSGPNTLAETG
jgi:hypothetical protein